MTEQQIPSPGLSTTRTPLNTNGASVPRTGGAWTGWVTFGGVMMAVIGGFAIVEGLVAIFAPTYIAIGPNGVLAFDISGWGWIHLLLGVLVLATGVALLGSAPGWARGVGVFLVAVNLIVQLTFLPAYPLWSIVVIALDMVVLFALTVTWSDARMD